jgi:hypothetical protein
MVTHVVREYHIERFWDDEFKKLDYIQEPFNDPVSVLRWNSQGYTSKICGALCDMRHQLPAWTSKFIKMYEVRPKQDVSKLLQLDKERHTKLVNLLKGYSETESLIKYLVLMRTIPD